MQSRTKYPIDEADIFRLFAANGIKGVLHAEPLGDGEFNAVYLVHTEQKDYVLKIAPRDGAPVMAYEKNMMQSEVAWYARMREQTSIRVPEVYAADFYKKLLPVDYFIMEYLPGEPLNKAALMQKERAQATSLLCQMAAQMHAIQSAQFGYPQMGLHESWYAAIHAFVMLALEDCARKNRRSPRGERLLNEIERHKDVLLRVEGCLVNFDIWPANIIVQREEGEIRLCWIDPERCFWGDRMLDFVCFAFHRPLEQKPSVLSAYNAAAKTPVTLSREEKVRYAIGQGYLALIMETEKYYRYSPFLFGWWRNVFACRMLYRAAFRALRAS